jgi:hypothetical protein
MEREHFFGRVEDVRPAQRGPLPSQFFPPVVVPGRSAGFDFD